MCNDSAPHAHATITHWHLSPDYEPRERIPLEPVDDVSVTTILDNTSDMLLLDRGPAKRPPLGRSHAQIEAPTLLEGKVGDALLAQHGFSALVTVRKNDHTHRILFDAGITPDGVVENMRRLDLDPGDLEVIVCSHGHFDHTTGLGGLARKLRPVNLPVVIHPEFWSRRRLAIPGIDPIELPTTSKQALVDAGFEVIEAPMPSFLFGRSILVTGEIDRTTAFEQGFPFHEALRGEQWEPDPLILDDQAIVFDVRDKGLVILTGCGHAGIVNIVRHAQRLTGVERVHAVMGGFHLNGPLFSAVIPETVQELSTLAPQWVVPAHCTGFQAQSALADAMPDSFIQNSVGTRYEFTAA